MDFAHIHAPPAPGLFSMRIIVTPIELLILDPGNGEVGVWNSHLYMLSITAIHLVLTMCTGPRGQESRIKGSIKSSQVGRRDRNAEMQK